MRLILTLKAGPDGLQKNRAQFSMERSVPMPRKKFSDERIAFALSQANGGAFLIQILHFVPVVVLSST